MKKEKSVSFINAGLMLAAAVRIPKLVCLATPD
jgi:hypothetical protein